MAFFPMRYVAFFKRVKELVMKGLIGDVISIMHLGAYMKQHGLCNDGK